MDRMRPPMHRIVAIVRATANVALLLGAITLLVAWAMHWPPETVAPIGLFTIAVFLISFFAIIIENRLPQADEDTEGDPG